MSIGIVHILGIVLTLSLIIGVGIYSGTKVKKGSDFSSGGGKAGPWIVCGTIMGALVGGQATIGTAQLGFMCGLSAWWFTLGSGIGCAIMAWGYVKPMRQSGSTTLMEVVSKEYGQPAEYVGSILSSIGIFISIIAQVVSACALITTLFDINPWIAIGISVVIMIIYVIFGGVWGAGMGGVVKLILLYGVSIVGLVIVLIYTKGVSGLFDLLNGTMLQTTIGDLYGTATSMEANSQFYSLVSRGVSKDIGSGISLIIGVLSTQTYASAIWAAKSDSAARKGALFSACLIPPIGIACIAIGIFMRGHAITADEVNQLVEMGKAVPDGLIRLETTAQVFPAFVVNYMPEFIGGMALATLLITIIGGGAGLSLGAAVIVVEDIICKVNHRIADNDNSRLAITRCMIVLILIAAAIVAGMDTGTVINDMGFLSMGLRGSVVFIPFTAALFMPGRIDAKAGLASIFAGPAVLIICNIIGVPLDPMFFGVGANIICVAAGYIINRRKTDVRLRS